MTAEAKTLADELRTIARCIYIAVEKTVADDIAGKATKAADFLDRLSAPVEGVGLTGDLPRIWLSNADNADSREGRFWAPDADIFPDDEGDPVEYVRADLAAAALAAKEAERNGIVENLGRALEDRAKKDGEIAVLLRERNALMARVAHFETCLEASDEVRAALSPAQGGK